MLNVVNPHFPDATPISGCLVTLFGYWLHKRDKK
ncbi:TPA: type I toxin-antitoxin system Fst family toxin [Staphylococcus aureus]|nr:type I toxin-antitoxin system Fst family toxin [Staphylococcus aureus]HCV9284440.1 type I toxin-antitoxin system Fst family toxin [Staphylococcus aureus]